MLTKFILRTIELSTIDNVAKTDTKIQKLEVIANIQQLQAPCLHISAKDGPDAQMQEHPHMVVLYVCVPRCCRKWPWMPFISSKMTLFSLASD